MENKEAYIKITKLDDGKLGIEMKNMSLLEITASSMLLLDKVYDSLMKSEHLEMAEIVGSVLQTVAALVQLGSTNAKGN